MHSALCLVFACKICKKCKITSQSRIDGISTRLLEATGVFRVATKCGYGPTKGNCPLIAVQLGSVSDGGQGKFPLSTEGQQEAGQWITSQSHIACKSIPPPLEGASSICVSHPIVLTGSGSLSSTAKRLCD